MPLDAESLVLIVFILLVLSWFSSGSVNTDNPLIWGPALVLQVPLSIFNYIASATPILVPLAIIGFLAYFNFLSNMLGEGFVALAVFGFIIVLIGV